MPVLLFGLGGLFALIGTASAVMAGVDHGIADERAAPAELRLLVSDASTGQPLAARVRVTRASVFERPEVLIAGPRELRMALAAGEYRVVASHGPEHSVARVSVVLRPGESQLQQLWLQREADSGRYVACDLHVHTDGSFDSRVALEERVVSAAAEGLRAAVITDHNRVLPEGMLPTAADTVLVRGIEITTWDPEFGHFNWFPSAHAPSYKHSDPARLLASLPRQPARFVQVNHPRLMQHIGYFELSAAAGVHASMRHGFDGVEVWNGYDLHRPSERDRVLFDWLSLIEHGQRVVATGGSDSHDLTHTLIGYPRTYVALDDAATFSDVELARALSRGRAFVSNGPILDLEVDGHVPGDTVVIPPRAAALHVRVRVDAPEFMDLQTLEIFVDAKRVWSEPIAALAGAGKPLERARAVIEVELPLPALSRSRGLHSVLAQVRGERPMSELFDEHEVRPFAFTNPVWITRRVGPGAARPPILQVHTGLADAPAGMR